MAIVSIVTAAATRQLTTGANVREVTGWSTSDVSDALMARLIDRASSAIEKALGRRLARERVIERQRLPAITRTFSLSLAPVVTLHTVTINGNAVEVTDLQIDSLETGRISYKVTASPLVSYGGLPDEPLFIVGRKTMSEFSFEYTGGYLLPADVGRDLPHVIETAAIYMVQLIKASTSRDPLLASERIGDASWSYRADTPAGSVVVPQSVIDTLYPFVRAM